MTKKKYNEPEEFEEEFVDDEFEKVCPICNLSVCKGALGYKCEYMEA